MQYARTCAHVLHLSACERLLVSHVVRVRQLSLHHIRKNFHVLVWMRVEARARLYHVVVYHAQYSELDILGIVIFRKGKVEMAVQPAMDPPSHFCMVNVSQHNLLPGKTYLH